MGLVVKYPKHDSDRTTIYKVAAVSGNGGLVVSGNSATVQPSELPEELKKDLVSMPGMSVNIAEPKVLDPITPTNGGAGIIVDAGTLYLLDGVKVKGGLGGSLYDTYEITREDGTKAMVFQAPDGGNGIEINQNENAKVSCKVSNKVRVEGGTGGAGVVSGNDVNPMVKASGGAGGHGFYVPASNHVDFAFFDVAVSGNSLGPVSGNSILESIR